ncbi:MAG: transposase [Longicatena sp.]
MYLCVKICLNVDEAIKKELLAYEYAFKKEVNRIYELFNVKGYVFEYAYKYFSKDISYNSKHLLLSCAKQKFELNKKGMDFSYPFSSYWSNSSYKINDEFIIVELGLARHRETIKIPIYCNKQPLQRIAEGRAMNMKIVCRKGKWFAYIYVDYKVKQVTSEKVMGIDIGIKVPAVCATCEQIKFFGSGRELRYLQRRYKKHIKEMQQRKQFKKLKSFEHKLNHVLNDYDHKIAREIVDFAIANDIGIIKMENLTRIKMKFQTYHNPNIYLWSYRRLQDYIEYKANLSGIKVVYINPYNTSKVCPRCGQINKAIDRDYRCKCGFHGHRDVVGAMNILQAL